MILEEDYVPNSEDAKTSLDLQERADGFFRILNGGIEYHIPVTKEMKKLLKLKRRDKTIEFPTHKSSYMVEHMLRDIISAVYLQLRDTVGSEIKEDLMTELKDSIGKMLSKKFDNVIEERMTEKEQKLLSPGNEKKEEREQHEGEGKQ